MTYDQFKINGRKFSFLLLIISISISVFTAEILLSFITPIAPKAHETTVVRNIRLREHQPSTNLSVKPSDEYMRKTDSLLQKAFRFEVDEEGYIYPSSVHEKPDMTLLFIGGSTTECIYVDEKNRFPYLVGRLMEKDGRKVNSFNSGVSGSHTMHSINTLLNKGLKLNPSIAVMMHNINDLNILLYEKTYWNENPERSLLSISNNIPPYKHVNLKNVIHKILPNIYNRLSILRNTYLDKSNRQNDEFSHIRGTKLVVNESEILEKFSQNLQTFINISKAYGVVPVLMTQANRFVKKPDEVVIKNWKLEKEFGITYAEYWDIYQKMNQSTRQVGLSNNILVIDLANEIPQNNTYMYDVIHFNDKGSRFAASLIAKQLGNLARSKGIDSNTATSHVK